MTVAGDIWSERLTSKTAAVSLWAKLNRRGVRKVNMRDAGFLKFMQSLAKKGPGVDEVFDGVDYRFQLHSAFD